MMVNTINKKEKMKIRSLRIYNRSSLHENVKCLTVVVILFVLPAILQPGLSQTAGVWKPLFNGKNLNGWTITGGDGKVRVENGCIVLNRKANTQEHTFLRTNKIFKDFIFEVDCRRDTAFHYGILFRAQNTSDTAHVRLNGYQVKVDHTARNWTGGIYDDFGTSWNWIYTLEQDKRAQHAEKAVGEWNHWRIEAIRNEIKVWLNGVPTAHLLNSKYNEGYIAFKIHFLGNDPEGEKASSWVKNIRIIDVNVPKYAMQMDIPARD